MPDKKPHPEKPSPPPHPWKKGDQGSYSMVVLEVQVCRDEHGRVFSSHQLQEDLDRETVMSWPGGGMEMISFGLLVEAARREAMFDILIQMSKDTEWVTKATASKETKTKAASELTKLLRVQTNRTLAKIAEGVVDEAFFVVADSCGRPTYPQ